MAHLCIHSVPVALIMVIHTVLLSAFFLAIVVDGSVMRDQATPAPVNTVCGPPCTTRLTAITRKLSEPFNAPVPMPDPSQDAYDDWFCRATPQLQYLRRGPGLTLFRLPQPEGDPRTWIPSPGLGRGLFEFGDFNTIASCGYPGMLALTMDDGPHPVNSHRVMDSLAGAGFRATFFWMGWSLAVHTNVAQRALREGHHLASHTWGHPDLTKVTVEQLDKEMKDTEAVISKLLGGHWRPRYMRPPYGSVNHGVMRRLRELGYRVILWNFDTNDWRPEVTPGHIRFQYSQLISHDPVKESFITLQHDVHSKTVHVAASVYEQIKASGFVVVPMYICLNEPAYAHGAVEA